MPFDFYLAYCEIHRAVYGREPCTREQWNQWCKAPPSHESERSDIEVDYAKEREGDAR